MHKWEYVLIKCQTSQLMDSREIGDWAMAYIDLTLPFVYVLI